MRIKLELGYGGGWMDIVFAPKSGQFLAYGNELDRVAIHSEWGGKQYYESRSGLSGAGFCFSSAASPLMKVGTYQSDTSRPHVGGPVAIGHKDFGPIYMYVPFRYREGFDHYAPVVYTDGHNAVYMDLDRRPPQEILDEWISVEWRHITIPAWDLCGRQADIHLRLFGRGVDVLSFVRPSQCLSAETISTRLVQSDPILARLGWHQVYDPVLFYNSGLWCHLSDTHPNTYIDAVLPRHLDPRDEESVPGGWVAHRKEYFWYRQTGRDQIYMILADYPHREDQGDDWSDCTEYEIECSMMEFFARDEGYWVGRCREGIEEKKAAAAEYERRGAENAEVRRLQSLAVKEILEAHPEMEVSIQDGYAQGFCAPGVQDFLDRHGIIPSGLTDTRTAAQFLALPAIDSMCENEDFARVVRMKAEKF